MVREGTYFFPINIYSRYYALQITKSINTNFSLRKIINRNINIICYDFKDVVPVCLRSISQNGYNNFPPLHIPMKEHDNIIGERIQDSMWKKSYV